MSRTALALSIVAVLTGCFGKRERPEPGPSGNPYVADGGASSGGSPSTGGAGTGGTPSNGGGGGGVGGGTGGGGGFLFVPCACAATIVSNGSVSCDQCITDNDAQISPACTIERDICLADSACSAALNDISLASTAGDIEIVLNSLYTAATLQMAEDVFTCLCASGVCGTQCDPSPQTCNITPK